MRATPFTNKELNAIIRSNPEGPLAAVLAEEVLYQRKWMARAASIIQFQGLSTPRLAKQRKEAFEYIIKCLRELINGRYVDIDHERLRNDYYRYLEEV